MAARRPTRRWWPVAAAAAVALLLAVLLPSLRGREGSAAAPAAAPDSALRAEIDATLDSTPRANAAAATGARSRQVTGSEAGDVDRDDAGAPSVTTDARCRSTASADQRACLLSRIERNDASLTRAYQALISEYRERAGGASEPPTVQELRVEQRAWLVDRDRRCRERVGGGALWGAARAPCFAEESRQRAAELRGRLREIGAG